MKISDLYAAYLGSSGIATDTRQIKANQLFLALKGPSFNANDFILEALASGASYAVADEPRPEFQNNDRIFIFDDALVAMQDLARLHRSKLKIPVIGLTGSNGKTTSKELLHAALSEQYKTYSTSGNLNNHIGVPLSILAIQKDHEIAIIEMGANHRSEIAFLCSISKPDYGFITNIGLAHLEGFGGEEGVYLGKKELFDYIRNTDGKIFINLDDEKVVRASEGHKGITYGKGKGAHFQGRAEVHSDCLSVYWWRDNDLEGRKIDTRLTGLYNFSNVMAAVTIARFFGVSDSKINHGISSYKPNNNRSQIKKTEKNNTVIVDCYNANPSSMSAALENLNEHSGDKKWVILGDMLEIGDLARVKHQEVVDQLTGFQFNALLVGPLFKNTKHPTDNVQYFKSTQEVASFLKLNPLTESTILLKGSRKIKLEQLLEFL
ncbi:MAG: UDP-N-acetylmuramoyl-tripeptide--D-alanyl-D-alanine ligase [Salibacteraceae bacterium]